MTETEETLEQLVQAHESTGKRVLAYMQDAASRAGLRTITGPAWHDAEFNLIHDPADGSRILVGIWRRAKGVKSGEVAIRDNGMCWAEWDVLQPHPTRAGWFIEAMTAWGTADDLRSEPRLLPLPEES